jgi:hypothetical protein
MYENSEENFAPRLAKPTSFFNSAKPYSKMLQVYLSFSRYASFDGI